MPLENHAAIIHSALGPSFTRLRTTQRCDVLEQVKMEEAALEKETASDCADLDPHGPWRLCCLCWRPVGDDIESHGIPVVDCIDCDWPIHWECCKHNETDKCGWRNRPEKSDDASSASDRPSPLQKTA